jgi:hypothetical protein
MDDAIEAAFRAGLLAGVAAVMTCLALGRGVTEGTGPPSAGWGGVAIGGVAAALWGLAWHTWREVDRMREEPRPW